MSEKEKLEYIAESMEMGLEELNPKQVLEELENWDSVAVLSIIAVINEKFERYPKAEEILSCKTVQDLMDALQ